MTLEDPFFVVKDEVYKALNKIRGLYLRWQEVLKYPSSPVNQDLEWITTELRNALRSIEWDLEDLEDTINIVERNSTKFKIDNKELNNRKNFIETTRQEVKCIKNKMQYSKARENDHEARERLLGSSPTFTTKTAWTSAPKYSRLTNQMDFENSNRYEDAYDSDIQNMQEKMLINQNDQLEMLSNTVGSLNTVSKQIGIELDEQAVMLDDMGTELENTYSKLDSTMKKVSKVLHLSNDKRQWWAIGLLIIILFIVLLLFIVL